MSKARTTAVLFLLSVLGLSFGCKNRETTFSVPHLKSIVKSQKTVYQYGEPIDIVYEITNDNLFTITVAQQAIKAKLLNGTLCKFTSGRTDHLRVNEKGKNPEDDIPPEKTLTGKGEVGTFKLTPGKWQVWLSWQYDFKSKYPASRLFPYLQDSSPVELEVSPLDSASYPLLADAINDSHIPLEERIQLISAILDLPQSSFFVPKLIEALNDPAPRIWVVASRVLGFMGDDRAVPPLIEGLEKHRNACFVMALGDIKAAAAVPYLMDLLQKIGKAEILLDTKDTKILMLKSTDQALSQITGQPSVCNLDTNPEKSGELIQKWSEWWEKNKLANQTKSLSNVKEWRQEETPDATVTVLSGVTT